MIRHNGITIDRKWQRVEYCGKARRFARYKFRVLCALLLAGPKNTDELFGIVYRNDPEGGPLTGREVVDQQMWLLRPQIREIGLEIRSHRFNGRVRYWVAPSAADTRKEAA